MTIHYRQAMLSDCHALAVLKGQVWKTTYRGIYSDEALDNYDVAHNQCIFETIVANPDIRLYLAECDGKPVGLMSCGKPFRPYADFQQEVGLLYILKEYQRKGIGRGFWDIARKQAQENGCCQFLVSVNRRNQHAIDFYLAMGGRIIAEEEKQLRITFPL